MAATYEPIVRIDGAPISPGWSSVDPAALEPVVIDWGASSHYDEVPPAVLTLEVVQPAADGGNVHAYQDRAVEIWMPERTPTADPEKIDGPRRIFKGRVVGVVWRRIESWDEQAGENRPYWVARITATDSSAPVRQLVPAGTGTNGTDPSHWRNWQRLWYEVAGYSPSYREYTSPVTGDSWGTLASFGAAVDSALRSGHVSAVTKRWDAAPAAVLRSGAEGPTVWEILREVYGTVPLAEPAYIPNTDTIGPTYPADRPTVALVYRSGVLTIPHADVIETGLRVISADLLEVEDDSFQVSTDGATRIGSIEITTIHARYQCLDVPTPPGIPGTPADQYPTWPIWDWKQEKLARVRSVAGGESAVYRRSLWMSTRDRPNVSTPVMEDASDPGPAFKHDQVLTNIQAAVASLNGKTPPPESTFDLEASIGKLDPSVARGLLQPWPAFHRNRPILITGAVTTGEMGTEAVSQIIGGRLEYAGGWRHTLRLAPTSYTAPPSLTYAQLVTNSAATWDSWDDQLTYGDWAAINQGAS